MAEPASVGAPVLEVKDCQTREGHGGAREDDHVHIGRVGLGDIKQVARHGRSDQVSESDTAVQQACDGRETVQAVDVGNDRGDHTEVASTGETVDNGKGGQDRDCGSDGPDAEDAQTADQGANEEHVDPADTVGDKAERETAQKRGAVQDTDQQGSRGGSLAVEHSKG